MENNANLKRSERRKHKRKNENNSTIRNILKFLGYAILIYSFVNHKINSSQTYLNASLL
ncbi:MAG: hypothetical protein IMW84_04665 [Thermoanaerobacter sp.]|nr:hypothetical protein [Thermoanaerobacter sp.]